MSQNAFSAIFLVLRMSQKAFSAIFLVLRMSQKAFSAIFLVLRRVNPSVPKLGIFSEPTGLPVGALYYVTSYKPTALVIGLQKKKLVRHLIYNLKMLKFTSKLQWNEKDGSLLNSHFHFPVYNDT